MAWVTVGIVAWVVACTVVAVVVGRMVSYADSRSRAGWSSEARWLDDEVGRALAGVRGRPRADAP